MKLIATIFLLAIIPNLSLASDEEIKEIEVRPGLFASTSNPGCIGEHSRDASAACEELCVDIPASSRINFVTYELRTHRSGDFIKVDPNETLDRAKFDGKYRVNSFKTGVEVCVLVKNWNSRSEVYARLKVNFD